jgi:hypothetical protein
MGPMENNRNFKMVYIDRGGAGLSVMTAEGRHPLHWKPWIPACADDDDVIYQNGLIQRCPDVLAKLGQHLGFKPGVVAEPADIAR